jgi:hypothetical protein
LLGDDGPPLPAAVGQPFEIWAEAEGIPSTGTPPETSTPATKTELHFVRIGHTPLHRVLIVFA